MCLVLGAADVNRLRFFVIAVVHFANNKNFHE